MSESPPVAAPPSMRMVYIAMGLFVLIAAAAAYWLSMRPIVQDALPIYYPLPEFSVTNAQGETITKQTLQGKVWVADFFFTICPGPCLALAKRFGEIEKNLPADGSMRLVSFSVDPKRDQPPVLAAYAERHGADPAKWWFVTTPKEKMYPLIKDGFKLPLEDRSNDNLPLESQFIHSTRVVLIDQLGRVRGYYDGLDDQSMFNLKRDMQQLALTPPKAGDGEGEGR